MIKPVYIYHRIACIMTPTYLLFSVIYCAGAGFFLTIRLSEVSSLVCYNSVGLFMVSLAVAGLFSLFVYPSKSFRFCVRRFALISLVSCVHDTNLSPYTMIA
jgi:hypothetical protein